MPAPRQRAERREIMNLTATVTLTVTVTNPYGTRRAIRLLRLVRQCGR